MSIYRGPHSTPANDVNDFAQGVAQPHAIVVQRDAGFAFCRKARPANLLMKATAEWVERLPKDVRPRALINRYPRIANALAQAWSEPEGPSAYFDELLLNSRGGRQGFPEDVLRDLLALEAHYQNKHPHCEEPWQSAG